MNLLTLDMHVQGKHAGYDQKHVQSIDPNYAAGFTFGSGLAKYALESATMTSAPGKINGVRELSQLAGTLPAASELLMGVPFRLQSPQQLTPFAAGSIKA